MFRWQILSYSWIIEATVCYNIDTSEQISMSFGSRVLKCWIYPILTRSVVGIATSYGLDDRGVRIPVPVGSKIFTSPYHPYRLWSPPALLCNGQSSSPCRVKNFHISLSSIPTLGSTWPPMQKIPGTLSPGGKAKRGLKLTNNQLVPSPVKKTWIYTSAPPYVFMA
jgi:hypothetical protein